MAIDPKLVSIKTAGELPVSDPSDNANFLFYEGEALKRSPMSNIYDKVSSGLLPATTATVPSAIGFERYIVHEAGTYTNFLSGGSPIEVTSADLDVVNGVANNEVILEVDDGVVTKRVRRLKGDVGDAANFKGVFTDIPSALAAVTVREIGDTVGIIEDGEVIEYWWNKNTTDLEKKIYTHRKENEQYVYAIVDSFNKVLLGIDAFGRLHGNLHDSIMINGENLQLKLLEIPQINNRITALDPFILKELTDDVYIYAITDSNNKVLFGIQKDGNLFLGNSAIQKGINSYNNVTDAAIAGEKNIFTVGETLLKPTRNDVSLKGTFANFKASDIVDQFDLMTSSINIEPKAFSELIRINSPLDKAVIAGFSDKYTYFTDRLFLYRTKDEINHPCNKDTHSFEKFILPYPLPNQVIKGLIYSATETKDGDILIEIGNGQALTSGVDRNLYRINNVNQIVGNMVSGVKEMTVTNITHVASFDAPGTTVAKVLLAWNVSTYDNIVLLAPYSLGKSGQVHLSTDYGKTFTKIFSMISTAYVATRPNGSGGFGSIGYHPMPENVNPVMPSTMWDPVGNGNMHTHGVAYDPYWKRIWVVTGDSPNANSYTAIWYSDDMGKKWNRVELRKEMYPHTQAGTQFVSIIVMPNYVLFGCDGSGDGYYRYNRKSKDELPTVELAYQYTGQNSSLLVVAVGHCVGKDGVIYGAFSPDNDDFATQVGGVVASSNGYNFNKIFTDKYSAGTSTTAEINWVSRVAERPNYLMIEALNGGIIKINK